MLVVNIAIILFCILRGLSNPFIACIGVVFVSMTNPGEIYPLIGTLHAERIMAFVAVLSLFLQPGKKVFPQISKRLLWFWGAMFISIPLAFWPGGAFDFSLNFGKTLLYHVLIVNTVNTWKRFQTFILIFVVLIGWTATGAIWGYSHGLYDPQALVHGFERAEGLTSSNSNPNALGMTMVSALPLTALLFASSKSWKKLIALLVGLASLVTVVITGSRMSFSTLIALVLLFCATRKKGLLYIPVLLGLSMVSWMFIPSQYKERYAAITDIVKGKKEDESYDAHQFTRIAGYHMFMDNPITGVGAGQFAVANGTKYWPGPGKKQWLNSHNLYIQLASELGLVGIVLWLMFIRVFLKTTYALKEQFKERSLPAMAKYFPLACLFCLFTLFMSGWTGHNLYRTLWYQLCALVYVLHQLAEKDMITQSLEQTPSDKKAYLFEAEVGA